MPTSAYFSRINKRKNRAKATAKAKQQRYYPQITYYLTKIFVRTPKRQAKNLEMGRGKS